MKHLYRIILLITLLMVPFWAQSAEFGGYECTDDCSGHVAGYHWAEAHNITDATDCPDGNSQSFHEGCLAYVDDPNRGADEDDDGNEIDN